MIYAFVYSHTTEEVVCTVDRAYVPDLHWYFVEVFKEAEALSALEDARHVFPDDELELLYVIARRPSRPSTARVAPCTEPRDDDDPQAKEHHP